MQDSRVSRRAFGRAISAVGVAATVRGQQAFRARRSPANGIGGVILIMNTPLTESGAVDHDSLSDEVRFINRSGGKALVWGQLDPYLTTEERMQTMEVVVKANAGQKALVGLGAHGWDTEEMLKIARHAESVGADFLITRAPVNGHSQEDYRAYFRALGRATELPVIIQTSGGGGVKLAPSTDLIIDLAREFPNFGYVKEEAPVGKPLEILARQKELLAHRPPMKVVLSANFGLGLLYEMRLGVDGVISGSAMYTDVLTRIWDLHLRNEPEKLRDVYSRYLLMREMSSQIPGTDLYIWKKRGVFKTMTTRRGVPGKPGEYTVHSTKLTDVEIAEIEYRYAGLRPYLSKEVG
jgi:4-hydroxy-tetrahydrodipicolinate synthase